MNGPENQVNAGGQSTAPRLAANTQTGKARVARSSRPVMLDGVARNPSGGHASSRKSPDFGAQRDALSVARFLLRTLDLAFYDLLICFVDRLSQLPRDRCAPTGGFGASPCLANSLVT